MGLPDTEFILRRILGDHTLDDVREAFDLDHQENRRFSSFQIVALKGDRVQIKGQFLRDGKRIAVDSPYDWDFERELRYAKGSGQAIHHTIEVHPSCRGQHIAWFHYLRVLRFYDRTPVRVIHLLAGAEGAWTWPQFGFDLTCIAHKSALRKIAVAHGIRDLPLDRNIYAADIATTTDAYDNPIGVDCFKELEDRLQQDLPMVLRLDDPVHRRFLVENHILDAEEHSSDETRIYISDQ